MNTNDERIHILNLVQQGKLDLQEATKRLYGMDSTNSAPGWQNTASEQKQNRLVHIQKKDLVSGKLVIDLTIPINLLEAGRRIGARYSPELSALTKDQIKELANAPNGHVLADYQDEDAGFSTRIFVD